MPSWTASTTPCTPSRPCDGQPCPRPAGRPGHGALDASLDQCRAPAAPAAGPGGNTQYLEAGQGLILGTHLGVGSHRPSAARALPPGPTLLLYTDGLIEPTGSDLDSGLGRLRRHALASRTNRCTPCATSCPPGFRPAAPTTSPSSPCADRGGP
ncbi:SpoIIE family protein phosphatase [Streptomyces sp. NPDC007856]|uniref:SpoIIE family protein phosphatase n=1 Tax=Streptomyces sp. NPDC007856 TaxID=3364781 RepID=UPI003693C019